MRFQARLSGQIGEAEYRPIGNFETETRYDTRCLMLSTQRVTGTSNFRISKDR